jgi:taurine dioxygenase
MRGANGWSWFHDQNSDPQLIDFSKNFGELDPPGPNPYGTPFFAAHPELNVISNVVEDGKPTGNLGDGEAVWHADMTYVEVPPKAAMLHALEVPPPQAGGHTYFAHMFLASDPLPAGLDTAAPGSVACMTPRPTAPACCRVIRRSRTCDGPSAHHFGAHRAGDRP